MIRPWLGLRGRAAPGGVGWSTSTPAARPTSAALQAGDVVESIDGVEVRTLAGLLAEVDRQSVGDTVELRGPARGQPRRVTVRLEERPATVPAG